MELIAAAAVLLALKCLIEAGRTRAELARLRRQVEADPETEAWYQDLRRRAE